MKRLFSYIVLPVALVGIFLILHSREVQALEITASLTPQSLQVESYGQLQVMVTGSRKAKIKVPEVDGLTIQNRGTMQSMQIINGDTTISYTANYIVIPEHEGTFTIDPITATAKGETVTAAPIHFEVTAAGSSSPRNKTLTTEDGNADNKLAFLRFIPKKSRIYVGEKVPFQLKAYFKPNARDLTLPILDGDGFIVSPFSKTPQQQQETYNGETYTVLTWNDTFSGVKSGTFPLQFALSSTLLIPRQQQHRDLDPFFDNFFSRSRFQQVPVVLKNESTDITVAPLPLDQQPADFSGAVGQFSLSASADPLKVSPGEPINLKLIITGEGNFDRVQCPEFPDTTNFKIYQANESDDSSQEDKVFERAVVPKTSHANTIPAHSLTYFDPEQEQYVTTTSLPISLTVAAQAETATPPPVKNEPAVKTEIQKQVASMTTVKPRLLDHLAPQKINAGSYSKSIVPIYKKLWFVTVTLLLGLSLVSLLFIALRRNAAQRNPERQLEKQHRLQKQLHLQAIDNARLSADANKIIESCRTALQYQAGLISGVLPSAVTAVSLAQQHSVSQSLIDLLKIAEEYCYGGMLSHYPDATEYAAAVKKELEGMV